MTEDKKNQKPEGAKKAKRQFVTFLVGRYFFGIDVTRVQEVLRRQDMTGVPLAPTVIKGLINLRGQIIPAIDVRTRLGIEVDAAADEPMTVVSRADGETVSFLVDEIGDVVEVFESQFESTPATVREDWAGVVDGVYKLDGRLLLALNPEKAAIVGG